jgi:epoxyqueuosine reductase
MIQSEQVKSLTLELGADQCGIAGVDRFAGAPEGFRPRDIYSRCRSVVVFLKKMPGESMFAENPVVYSHTANLIYRILDAIGLNLCSRLEDLKVSAVLVPCDDPYIYWDAARMHGMGILSMRHAARNAGLGILGRNTLLINPEFGNRVYIGAILVAEEMDPDPLITGLTCPPGCRICLDACPVQALDGVTVNQMLCRKQSCLHLERGWDIYGCTSCRKVCPWNRGINNS